MMVKGHRGQTCAEAIYEVVESDQPAPFEEILEKVRLEGEWTVDTVCQQAMQFVINMPPAYHHWDHKRDRFLFLRPDGLFELYDESKHGVFDEGTRVEPPG